MTGSFSKGHWVAELESVLGSKKRKLQTLPGLAA